jgi:TatD DNase family protein
MTQFIDTHVHLYDPDFDADICNVVSRAKESGVVKVILPAIDKSHYKVMVERCALLDGYAYAAIGLHPTSVKENWREELQYVVERCKEERFIAIGEIGLDGYWSKEHFHYQRVVFEEQLRLSSERSLPVIIHSRDATEEIFNVLDRCSDVNLKGVFHAFSGSFETYERVQKYGDFMIGVGGVVTFKNSSLAEVVRRVPLDRVVLETDGPWLTPSPHRGKRNEPSFIRIIAEKIAQIKKCTVEEVAAVTTENAIRIFDLQRHERENHLAEVSKTKII